MYCYNCMNEMREGRYCSMCGCDNSITNAPHQLKPGSLLNNRYIVGRVLGEGGFGITYIGIDTMLRIRVAVKEYYPNGYVNRNNAVTNEITITSEKYKDFFSRGKLRFLDEARNIAKFNQEKGIVDVRDYFEENDTAYIIMEYLDGQTLRDYIKKNGVMDVRRLFSLLMPVMKSLEKIHSTGIIHRDISPDNIMYLKDGTLKLMDFGAARHFANEENQLSVVLKMGYAPEEQYRKNGDQGPWTDVYALCATVYRCITGALPEDALDRLHKDTLKKPSELGAVISESFENILIYGLAVHKENRCHNMTELMSLVNRAQNNYRIYFPNAFVTSEDAANKTKVANENDVTLIAHSFDEGNQKQYDGIEKSTLYTEEQTKKKSKKGLIVFIVVFLCFLIGIGGAVYFVLSSNAGDDNSKESKNKVSKNNISHGSSTTEITEEETETPTEEITVEPTEDTSVKISDFTDYKLSDAKTELEKLGLKVKTEYAAKDNYKRDVVYSQSVKKGETLQKGDTITLYVSKGKFKITFNANGGYVSTSSKSVVCGDALGSLPTPTRNYYTFQGWYDSSGSKVSSGTVFTNYSDVTLKAKWSQNAVSGWVKANSVPAGAEIVKTKWTYTKTETTTSTSSSMSGWTQTGSSWKQTKTGTHYYASYPGGFNGSRNYSSSAISSYENSTQKRSASSASACSYIYWHWCRGKHFGAAVSNYNRKISDCYTSEFCAHHWFESGTNISYNSACQAYWFVNQGACDDTCWWNRFTIYKQTYTDYQKQFTYSRTTSVESSTEVKSGGNISNVQKWVQYRAK